MMGPGAYLIGEEEKKSIMEVAESGWLFRYYFGGERKFCRKVLDFEEAFAKWSGTKHSIGVNSGTSALIAAIKGLGIGEGDEVLVPGYTFIATMSAVALSGATPVLCEINESLTIDPDDIEKKITPKTKAIIPVHMLGNVCDMDRILAIAKKYDLFVIEDCCQACGADYKGRRVGSMGDAGCFSLNNFKAISTGDGGIVVMNDDELYRRAYGVSDQGHAPLREEACEDDRNSVGYNFRMTELSGAVALAQLEKLPYIYKTLHENKAKFKSLLGELPGAHYREIYSDGEICTFVGVIFDDAEVAKKVTDTLGCKPVSESGWHNYANMKPLGYELGMLPQTDDILPRAVIFSVGVVDAGLGGNIGINILSDDQEIEETAAKIRKVIEECAR